MAAYASDTLRGSLEAERGDGRRREDLAERSRGGGWSGMGLLVTGLAVVGLGALAWYYIGPDVRRYMKMRNM
jgi:hypothetical protein